MLQLLSWKHGCKIHVKEFVTVQLTEYELLSQLYLQINWLFTRIKAEKVKYTHCHSKCPFSKKFSI